ncbi:MAG: hypothetical protein ACD_83C00262G0001 [uncultured bacterium]|nr:MAG: hypothetical protein ACD_83C00262G0001 [uncultured bacterium]
MILYTEIMIQIIQAKLSYKLVGLCFQVHNELGRFCREKQYSDLLETLLLEYNIRFHKEVFIDNETRSNKPDYIIEDTIIIDLKAKRVITKEDYYQMQRYLKNSNIQLGIIVNFRDSFLKPKRVINTSFNHS